MTSSLFLILRHFRKDHPICMCLTRGFFITFKFLILYTYFCLFVCYCCLLFVLLFLQTKCYIILCCTLFFLIVLIVIVVLVYQQLNSILPEDGWFFCFWKKILSYTFYFVCECIYYYNSFFSFFHFSLWSSTCYLVFDCWELSHIIFFKLRKKELLTKLSTFTKWQLSSLKMVLGCCFEWK